MAKPDLNIEMVPNILVHLKEHCHLSEADDYLSVTEWPNGEGYDVSISRKTNEQRFNVTCGEFNLLKQVIHKLDGRFVQTPQNNVAAGALSERQTYQ
jgi:hypothetical protein